MSDDDEVFCDECGDVLVDGEEHATCNDCSVCYNINDEEHEECSECGTCKSHYHDTCYDCGDCLESGNHQSCDSCGSCAKDGPCGCWGFSRIKKWDSIKAKHKSWKDAWPFLAEHYKKVDPLVAAADFYLLEAMSAGVIHRVEGATASKIGENADNEFFDLLGVTRDDVKPIVKDRDRRVQELRTSDPDFNLAYTMGTAETMLDKFVEFLDRLFIEYVHLAVGGELRYHHALRDDNLITARSSAWARWRAIADECGPEALKDASRLFMEIDDGSYCGPGWANAAEVLHGRLVGSLGPNERINKRMFVDRVWTLEHNNGCLLDKVGWATTNQAGYSIGYMSDLLDCHHADPPEFDYLIGFASYKVKNLYDTYHNAVSEVSLQRGWDTPPKIETRF